MWERAHATLIKEVHAVKHIVHANHEEQISLLMLMILGLFLGMKRAKILGS